MFMKNRSFNVKVVKDPVNGSEPDETTDPFEGVQVAAAYAEVAKDFVTHTALVIGGVFAACKIIERICR